MSTHERGTSTQKRRGSKWRRTVSRPRSVSEVDVGEKPEPVT